MSRYIDADKLIETATARIKTIRKSVYARMLLRMIEDAPTADVVEVVRCKDCRWYETIIDTMFCGNTGSSFYGNPNPNDFCPYGERKEE